jgi:hypothetical protein
MAYGRVHRGGIFSEIAGSGKIFYPETLDSVLEVKRPAVGREH